ncbi:MAG: geranyl transferase, partial [Clostridiales bacterium]|nr:geranyl transferase [Clostridiales bacterium]
GVHAAGGADGQLEAASRYAKSAGMAFQIRDDVLDGTATSAQLGKSSGSDAASGKATFFSLLGVERCGELIAFETERAKQAIRWAFPDTEFLSRLADELAEREN